MVGTGILNPTVSQVAQSSMPPEQSGLAVAVPADVALETS